MTLWREVRTDRGGQERLLVGLLTAATVLTAASLVLPRVPPWAVLRDPSLPWVVLLDVRDEGSLHTWFNVALLVTAAAGACLNAVVRRSSRSRSWPWWTVAAAMAALSVDDMLSLHEQLEAAGGRLVGGGQALHFAWVVPGAVLGGGLALAVVLAARGLPRCSRTPLVAGLALLLAAALGLEAVSGAVITAVGDGPAYILVSHLEEGLESFGACLLAYGVLRGLRWAAGADGVTVQPTDAPA